MIRSLADLQARVENVVTNVAQTLCIGYSPDFRGALWDVLRELVDEASDMPQHEEDEKMRALAGFDDDEP